MRLLRLLNARDAFLGWVHALLSAVLATSVGVGAAAFMVLWDLPVTGLVFAAIVCVASGTLGFLRIARRASVRLANGLLGSEVPTPLLHRRFATAAWLMIWMCAGGALMVATALALFALALPAVWLNGGGTITFVARLDLPAGGAGSWTVAIAACALIALTYLGAAYAFVMRALARRLLGPGLAERLAAAEAEADREAARNRLARDLHDSIGHTLTASAIQAAVAKQVLDSDPGGARRAMDAIEDTSRAALEDLDRALGILRGEPASSRPEPTLADLGELRDRIVQAGTELTVEFDGEPGAVEPVISQEAYRIVQEGITNALRHAPGTAIHLRIEVTESQLALRVSNPIIKRAGDRSSGHGLTGIAERARLLGGTATAGPDDGSDWVLRATLPLKEERLAGREALLPANAAHGLRPGPKETTRLASPMQPRTLMKSSRPRRRHRPAAGRVGRPRCWPWREGPKEFWPRLDPQVTRAHSVAGMSHRELLSIGEFSVKTGLSIPALRHYDEVDLLRPARVDPGTGYRRYRPDQAAQATLIRRLRSVDLPIDQIRTMLADQSGQDVTAVLLAHRERLLERAHAITQLAETLGRDHEEGTEMAVAKEDRMVQVTLPARELEATVRFYTEAFGLEYDQSISSFQFGAWETDSFFLLTLDAAAGKSGDFGPAMFGLYVDDLDTAHAAALSAGATLVQSPFETDYAPRRSVVADPSGNRISLTQR